MGTDISSVLESELDDTTGADEPATPPAGRTERVVTEPAENRNLAHGGRPRGGTTLLAAHTATAPLVADVQTYQGVHTANAWLCGDRDTPMLRLTVAAEPDADLTALREQIATHAAFRLRQALELPELPTSVQFRIAPGKPTRHRTELS